MIEKAVHLKSIKNLSRVDKTVFSRIYWGAEFCQKLIPGIAETEKVLSFSAAHGLCVSLVFPFLTESGLARAMQVCSWVKENQYRPELIVNDWGMLQAIRTAFPGVFSMALGRLLARQQRMPTARAIMEPQPPVGIKMKGGKKIVIVYHKIPKRNNRLAMRSAYVNVPLSNRKLRSWGIERVELNNVIQGVNLQGIELKKSLYTPWVHISTTRYCPMGTLSQKKKRISECSRQCLNSLDLLYSRALPFPLIKQGNSIFYENPVLETSMPPGIDRIVVQAQE